MAKSMGDLRTYLIVKTNGDQFQVDIPVTWKVTFGPAVVGGGEKYSGKMPMALRFYESEKTQRAIFTDVASFRDMSIPLREKRVKVQSKVGHMECEGSRKAVTFQATTHDWVNPDEEVTSDPSKLLEMPTDTEIFGEE